MKHIFILILILLTVFCYGCRNTDALPDRGTETGAPLDDTRKETENQSSSTEVEHLSVLFSSVDDLLKTMKEYPENAELQKDSVYTFNKFGELSLACYPELNVEGFSLLQIQINPYNVFFYFVPTGTTMFLYETGYLVTFPREKEATIDAVAKQCNATLETDGSFFDNGYYFLPLGDHYYSIHYPDKADLNKNVVTLHQIES